MEDTYVESEKDIAFKKMVEADANQGAKIDAIAFKIAKLELACTLMLVVLRQVVGPENPLLIRIERILSSG